MTMHTVVSGERWTITRVVGLVLGPLLALALVWLLPQEQKDASGAVVSGMSEGARWTIAIGAWLAAWWISEAIPIEAAALLPLALFPLAGVTPSFAAAAAPYAEEVIFLFLGGMLLGCAMERWGLHRRVALLVMLALGTSPVRLIGGLLVATAFISMWVSNTAAAIMMLPIGVGVIRLAQEGSERASGGGGREEGAGAAHVRHFGIAAMLAIAYGASIGGVATIVGTPPNGVAVGFLSREYGDDITFARWLGLGLPVMLITLPLCWALLVVLHPVRGLRIAGAREMLARERDGLGKMSRGEWLVVAVFGCAAAAWIFREPLAEALGLVRMDGARRVLLLTDAGIAIIASLLLFLIPVDRRQGVMLLDWKTARTIPWGVLLLFGGGLSLASAITANGVDDVVAGLFKGLAGVHPLVVLLVVTATAVFASEIGSNTAMATVLLPVMAAVAPVLGIEPYLLIFAVTLGVSLAFMMPSGTPPNALVFSSGMLRVPLMVRAGFFLNLACVLVITGAVWVLLPLLGLRAPA